jgi:hypothetical protein
VVVLWRRIRWFDMGERTNAASTTMPVWSSTMRIRLRPALLYV